MDAKESVTLYAPNLHLFAFHLWRGLTGDPDSLAPNPQYLWQQGDEILARLGFTERLHLYGYPEKSAEPIGSEVNLKQNQQLKLTGKLGNLSHNDLTITGRVLTYRLYDSYGLIVNLRRPELEHGQKTAEVPISLWRELNPEPGIFLPNFVQSSLGQTLLLTAFFSESEHNSAANAANAANDAKLEQFAQRCLRQLIPAKKNRPRLEKVGELFGSPIFEFGGQILDLDIYNEPERDAHVLVWLFREDLPSAKFVDAYRQFINLFYYRNKIVSAYGETRRLYRKTYQIYIQLEQNVKLFKESLTQDSDRPQLSEAELDRLKEVLKKLSQLDLEYARLLRNYKHSRNTIAINAKNYQVSLDNILRQLQEKDYAVQPSDLDFFRELTDRTCPYFQTRISDELNYFIEGSNLADKAIASIRGIVEIEQTQRDHLRQNQEKHLENTIQALGIAIGTGAIFASSAGLITEPWRSPWDSDRSDYPHPFIIAFVGSFAIAIIVYGLVKLGQWLNKPKSQ